MSEYNSLHPDTLNNYVLMARHLIKKDDYINIARADYFNATHLIRKGKMDSAGILVDKYLADKAITKEIGLVYKFGFTKTSILVRNNKLKEALENALSVLHNAEKDRSAEFEIKAQIHIGWVYMELAKNEDALEWFLKALDNCEENNYKYNPSVLYSNIAAVYNAIKKNDTATRFIEKAIELAEKEQDLTFLCNALYIYSDICTDQGNIEKAERLLKEGVGIRKKIGDPFYIVSDLAQLGKFYANNNQVDKGIITIKEGIDIAAKNKLTAKLIFLNSILAENYKAANDLANYGNVLNTIIALKDSLYNQNSAEAISELQTKYGLQKKENTIIQQRLDLIKKNYWVLGAMMMLVFGFILWIVVYKNNQRKQEQQLALIRFEEKALSEKAVKEAEEKERKRIAADLHDNLGAYAAAISSNVDHILNQPNGKEVAYYHQQLKSNSQAIVSQLNDSIWVLTKEMLTLTAISDRLKIFIQRQQINYPQVQIDVLEKIENDYQLASMQALHLFKILQEAILNALKHSQCNSINILFESNMHWKIIIADNGIGFMKEDARSASGGGNGLFNMKNRSKESGWHIDWRPNNPRGTIVVVSSTTN